jgi:hypothetical protein
MSNLSVNNKIISSAQRSRYIDKLKGNLGAINENSRTPLHYKIIDTYEDLTSNIPKRNIIVFILLFFITGIILYYTKPSFVLTQQSINSQLKITSDKKNEKVIGYWKLLFYSLIISIVLFSILYFLRNKSLYIGKIFKTDGI